MNTAVKSVLLGTLLGPVLASPVIPQDPGRSVQDIERQWKEYTSFQKHELISFCDFLFDEGYYERAILACFRFIFLYPEDDLVPAVYYWIARSYEETGNYDLAIDYYGQVLSEVDRASTEQRIPRYRITYLHLVKEDYDRVYADAQETGDPYFLVFAGYAKLAELQWEEATAYFSRALDAFESGSPHGRRLQRLIRACNLSSEVSRRSPVRTAAFGIFPGGGRAYLEQWYASLGTLVTVLGLSLGVLDREGSAVAAWVSPLALVAAYGGSILGSLQDVQYANTQRKHRYVQRVTSVLKPEDFLDFPEDRVFSLQ